MTQDILGIGSTSMTATLPSAEVLLDLLSSGNGMGIGKTAEQANLLDIEWPVRIGSKVTLRTDGEGGNVRLDAPDQYNRHWEMDAYNGNLRIYTQTNDNQNYHALTIATNGDLSTDGAIAANGNISCGGALTGQYGYLSTLTLGGNLVADYIIAQGTSGIWIYRKWASGVVECWGTARPSYANSNVLIVRVNLPFTFSSIAAILGALNDTGANAQAALDWNTKVQARNDNNTLDVVIHSYTGPFANGSVASVSLHVLGRA